MRILIAGDFCDKNRVTNYLLQNKYENLLGEILPVTSQHDYSIVNFEFPISTSSAEPIKKNGPNLSGHQEAVEAIKYAGFDCCTLANNHILDQGEDCGNYTKQVIEQYGMDTVGFGTNSTTSRDVLYKTIHDETLAVINCCEHEFSVATDISAGACGMDPIHQFYSIQEARKNADYIIVITHGGHEHFCHPSPRMKSLYRFFIDAGADVVINHHQHCYCGYEVYKNKQIFYGLGNFLFDNPNRRHMLWNLGYMVSLNMCKGIIDFSLIPYTQCNEEVTISLLKNDEVIVFKENIQALNTILVDDMKLKTIINAYYQESAVSELCVLEPYSSYWSTKLLSMGLLPNFIKGRKLASMLNHIECESHRDKLLYALKKAL